MSRSKLHRIDHFPLEEGTYLPTYSQCSVSVGKGTYSSSGCKRIRNECNPTQVESKRRTTEHLFPGDVRLLTYNVVIF